MFIAAVLLLIFMILGFAGLGSLTARLPGAPSDWAPAAALTGCGLVIWLTLISNLAGLFQLAVLFAAIGLGAAGWLATHRRSFWPARAAPVLAIWAWIVVLAVVGLLLLVPPEINLNDDTTAYLIFSEKLAQLGQTGPEPFSERRLYGFGGQLGLVAVIEGLLGARWLSLYEPVLGLALVGAWMLVAGRDLPASLLLRVSVVFGAALVWLTVGGKPIANLAPAVLYWAFLFGTTEAWLKIWDGEPPSVERDRWFALLAFYCAIALTLRPTAAPFIGLLGLSGCAVMLAGRRWKALGAATGIAGLIMAPAMTLSLRDSGTLFYPFLGLGVHGAETYLSTDPGDVFGQALKAVMSHALLVACLGIGSLMVLTRRVSPHAGFGLMAITVAAYAAVAWATGGLELARYTFPFVFAAFAAFAGRMEAPEVVARWAERLSRPAAIAAAAGLAVVVVGAFTPPGESVGRRLAASGLGYRWSQPLMRGGPEAAYRQAQAQTPAGASILAMELTYGNLLDVRRNRILAADQAAAAGPAPGWPTGTGPGVLRDYLAGAGVDYIAVSDNVMAPWTEFDTEWQRRLGAASELTRRQVETAVQGVAPVATGPDFRLYAVSELR